MVISLVFSFLACVFLGAVIGYLYACFRFGLDYYTEDNPLKALERVHRVQS